jgi:hypothetical protein
LEEYENEPEHARGHEHGQDFRYRSCAVVHGGETEPTIQPTKLDFLLLPTVGNNHTVTVKYFSKFEVEIKIALDINQRPDGFYS